MIDDSAPTTAQPLLDEAGGRYLVVEDEETATLAFHLDGDRLVLEHVAVPDGISRRGIGGSLVNAAVARAAKESLTVVPWCPFARHWLHQHPEAAQTVRIDWDSRRGA